MDEKNKSKHKPITKEELRESIEGLVMGVWLLWGALSVVSGIAQEIKHPLPGAENEFMALGIQVWVWFIRPHLVVIGIGVCFAVAVFLLVLIFMVLDGILTPLRYSLQQWRKNRGFFSD